MPRKTIEERRAYNREWRKKNPDKVLANQLRNAGAIKAYKKANRAIYAAHADKYRREKPQAAMIVNARSRAKKRGVEFTVAVSDVDWPTHCPILGVELHYGPRAPVRCRLATLDRRDNSLGYVKGNVFVISHRANRIKSDATPAELEAVLAYSKL